MSATRKQVELLEKNKPRQARAKRTYEAILAAAADLLVEVGVERISTNLIAVQAGITVPALYRYFPNKYAVLYALGARLMDVQNRVAEEWFEAHLDQGGALHLLDAIHPLLQATYEVTRAQPGALEILQSLRAVAPLRALGLTSHRQVAEHLATVVSPELPAVDAQSLALLTRLSVDVVYGAVEMALEEQAFPPQAILDQGARMLELYWRGVVERGV